MKLRKVFCTIIASALILANVGIGVQAATQLDTNNVITFSEEMTDGSGTVEIGRSVQNYRLYYQFVEVSNSTYNKIDKLKDKLEVAQAARLYEAEDTEQTYIRFVKLKDQYEAKYSEAFGSATDTDVQNMIDDLNELLMSKLFDEDKWSQTTSNTFKTDLSKFSGDKYYVVWIRLVNADTSDLVYDANIYKVTGTGSSDNNNGDNNNGDNNGNNNGNNNGENNGDNNNNGNNNGDNNGDNNNNGNNNGNTNNTNTTGDDNTNSTDAENTNNTNNTNTSNDDNTTKNDNIDTTKDSSTNKTNTSKDASTAKKSIPQTGADEAAVIAGMAIALVVGTVSFIRYRKIK